MNRGLFEAQLNNCWEIIRLLNLDKERIWRPEYSKRTASVFRQLTYTELWNTCLREQLYDFQLVDNSLLQFRIDSFHPIKVGYAYYECPYKCSSYIEFVSESGFRPKVVGDSFTKEYEDYVASCEKKDSITPLRYDYDISTYEEGRHPVSHVHFGFASNVRIGTQKILVKPLSFLLFLIRQYYPNDWVELLKHRRSRTWCRNVRDCLDDVDIIYRNDKDLLEMMLY